MKPRERQAPWIEGRWLLMVVVAVVAVLVQVVGPCPPSVSGTLGEQIAACLGDQGLVVADPAVAVVPLDEPGGAFAWLSSTAVVVEATLPEAAGSDLFVVSITATPDGTVTSCLPHTDLTASPDVPDTIVASSGSFVVTATTRQDGIDEVVLWDFGGEDPTTVGVAEWGLIGRLANGVVNVEETSFWAGVGVDRYLPDEPLAAVSATWTGSSLVVEGAGGAVAAIDSATKELLDGSAGFVHEGPPVKVAQAFLPWVAERGRRMVDPDLVELLKEVYFFALDTKAQLTGSTPEEEGSPEAIGITAEADQDETDGATDEPDDVADEPGTATPPPAAPQYAFAAAGARTSPWPPPPLVPILPHPYKGEGQWTPLTSDVITTPPNTPPLVYWTFIRPDKERDTSKVFVAVWDPAVLALKMMAGTKNPVSTTGVKSPGKIPRKPEYLSKVVAGFNGGFLTQHVSYGMMLDKTQIVPPKPNGATFASLEGDQTGYGSWPEGGESVPAPPELVSYRQNLPPLVEDGVFNPYNRKTWGWFKNVAGAKEGFTTRSAVCVTEEGYVQYFWAEHTNEKILAAVMFLSGCVWGMHLDMNTGHTGFEHYKLMETSAEKCKGPKRACKKIEVGGLEFCARRLVRYMSHMNFPRYLKTDYRDFFYLVLKDFLPGKDPPLVTGTKGPDNATWRADVFQWNEDFPPRAVFAPLTLSMGGVADMIVVDPGQLGVVHVPGASSGLAPPDSLVADELALMVSLGDASTVEAPATITLGEVSVSGVLAIEGGSPVAEGGDVVGPASLVGVDWRGFYVLVAIPEGASAGEVAPALAEWGVVDAVVRPLDTGTTPVVMFQTDGAGLFMGSPSEEAGSLVSALPAGPELLVLVTEGGPVRAVKLFGDVDTAPEPTE